MLRFPTGLAIGQFFNTPHVSPDIGVGGAGEGQACCLQPADCLLHVVETVSTHGDKGGTTRRHHTKSYPTTNTTTHRPLTPHTHTHSHTFSRSSSVQSMSRYNQVKSNVRHARSNLHWQDHFMTQFIYPGSNRARVMFKHLFWQVRVDLASPVRTTLRAKKSGSLNHHLVA